MIAMQCDVMRYATRAKIAKESRWGEERTVQAARGALVYTSLRGITSGSDHPSACPSVTDPGTRCERTNRARAWSGNDGDVGAGSGK